MELKSFAIQILPLSMPGTLFWRVSGASGARRAIGLPALAIKISLPAVTQANSFEEIAFWLHEC